jgi:SAM-dependent methyltransferase
MPVDEESCGVRQPPAGGYWDRVLASWEPSHAHRLWRAHSDAVNASLLRRWLPTRCDRLLKTDLFDEAVGGGLYPELVDRTGEFVGVDISGAVLSAAVKRYPNLNGRVADVRALPFASESFDLIVSNSTLDHFASAHSLRDSLVELGRSLVAGGQLIITLDNRTNPIVAVRTSPVFGVLHRLGIVPYFVGATHGYRRLGKLLHEVGFDVRQMTAIMHCPPQLAAHMTARARRSGSTESLELDQQHLRRVLRFEVMAQWPTRHLTGHFVAACAVKR